MRPRWQDDERGLGTAVPASAISGVDRLAAEMRSHGWLTESPELHLLPKVREWLSAHDEWRIENAEQTGDWWQLRVRRAGGGRKREVRADALALIGSFAEAVTMIRQVDVDGLTGFEVATGQPDSPAGFAPHGHLVRLVIESG